MLLQVAGLGVSSAIQKNKNTRKKNLLYIYKKKIKNTSYNNYTSRQRTIAYSPAIKAQESNSQRVGRCLSALRRRFLVVRYS